MKALFILLLCLAALALLVLGGSYRTMRLICCARGRNGRFVERRLRHMPDPELAALLPEAQLHPIERVGLTSYDGLHLVAELVPQKNARGTLIFFHGWHGSPVHDFGSALSYYYGKGFQLLLVHQRGQGLSEGRYMTFGIRERHDVHRWVEWHNARFDSTLPVYLVGLSMGATSVLMACGESFPSNVRGVIADCGFTEPYSIIAAVMRTHRLPLFPMLPLVGIQTRLFAGFGLREYSTLTALKNCPLPLLLIHGEADAFVPCQMSHQAYEAAASPYKRLLTVPKASHGKSFLVQGAAYRRALDNFFRHTL